MPDVDPSVAAGDGWTGNGTSGYLNGQIDEAAVYPTTLTATQIANHYALGK